MSDENQERLRCISCGVAFSQHVGLIGTCEQLIQTRAALVQLLWLIDKVDECRGKDRIFSEAEAVANARKLLSGKFYSEHRKAH